MLNIAINEDFLFDFTLAIVCNQTMIMVQLLFTTFKDCKTSSNLPAVSL